jgi:hypothetical protein
MVNHVFRLAKRGRDYSGTTLLSAINFPNNFKRFRRKPGSEPGTEAGLRQSESKKPQHLKACGF